MKRRIFLLLLALFLCLAGCEKAPGEESLPTLTDPVYTTEAPTTQPPETTAPPETTLPPETTGPVDPFPLGSIGSQTGGVVRSIPLSGNISHLRWFSGNLLLVQEGLFQILSPEDGSVLHSVRVTDTVQSNDSCLGIRDGVLAYYNIHAGGVVFRDAELNVIKTVPIPTERCASNLLVSGDLKTAYHFAGQVIYETDLETGKTRELFQAAHPLYELSGLVLDDTVIVYWGKDSQGDYYAYASLETGEDLGRLPLSLDFLARGGPIHAPGDPGGAYMLQPQRSVGSVPGTGAPWPG